jgi:hypothetical protein
MNKSLFINRCVVISLASYDSLPALFHTEDNF